MTPVADQGAYGYGFEPPRRRSRVGCVVGTLFMLALIAAAAVYVYGVRHYSEKTFPHTTVNKHDLSESEAQAIANVLRGDLARFSTFVRAEGLSFTLHADEVGLTQDTLPLAQDIIASQDVWRWPLEIQEEHAYEVELSPTADETLIAKAVEPYLRERDAESEGLVAGGLVFDEEEGRYTIDDRVLTMHIDRDAFVRSIAEQIVTRPEAIELGNEIFYADDALVASYEAANALIAHSVPLVFEGAEAFLVEPERIRGWIVFDDGELPHLDEEAMIAWARGELSEQFDTIGVERTYTRPDGKEVTVSGGTYGWNIDGEGTALALAESIRAGEGVPVEIGLYSSGARLPEEGGRDWDSWIDVDLTEQHARWYTADGELVWETDIVTGQPNAVNAKGEPENHSTPTGVYYIRDKATDVVLAGPIVEETQKPEWESPVDFWLPFRDNSIGLHNAPWRDEFGGSIYSWYGSHGCVNMPYDETADLYGRVEIGEPVIVHY